jgi:hypothetical protein
MESAGGGAAGAGATTGFGAAGTIAVFAGLPRSEQPASTMPAATVRSALAFMDHTA